MIRVAGNQKLRRKHKLMVKAIGLRDVLKMARKQGYRKICVEGNSKLEIDAIEGRSRFTWRIRSIIANIRSLASSFQNISLKHIFRETNFIEYAINSAGISSSILFLCV
ncbi:unnamed protein product [Malus baccata var. baccata]